MMIHHNGCETTVTHSQLDEVLDELGYCAGRVATAVNECFVPQSERPTKRLCPGDRLEVLAPMSGG